MFFPRHRSIFNNNESTCNTLHGFKLIFQCFFSHKNKSVCEVAILVRISVKAKQPIDTLNIYNIT